MKLDSKVRIKLTCNCTKSIKGELDKYCVVVLLKV